MKSHRSLYIVLAAVALLQVACAKTESKDELAQKLPLLDSLAGNFEPAATYKTFHYAVKVTYDGGNFAIDSTAMEMRNGRIPYANTSAGTMRIIAQDANRKEIGSYQFEDPTFRRVCEGEKKEVSRIEKAEFELLLPGTQALKHFELMADGKVVGKFEVPERIQRPRFPTFDPKGDTLD